MSISKEVVYLIVKVLISWNKFSETVDYWYTETWWVEMWEKDYQNQFSYCINFCIMNHA